MVLRPRRCHEVVGLTDLTIQRSVVAVPARLASSRLPGKVLADIGGKPMIQRVLEQCAKADGPAEVVLCTDSEQLQQMAQDWGFSVLMTSSNCSSGSERIASVWPISWSLELGGSRWMVGMLRCGGRVLKAPQ